MSTPWRALFDASTPWAVVERIIEERAAIAVAALRDQLAADASLTEAQRSALLTRAVPQIGQATRDAIEAGWQRLQDERSGTRLQ